MVREKQPVFYHENGQFEKLQRLYMLSSDVAPKNHQVDQHKEFNH